MSLVECGRFRGAEKPYFNRYKRLLWLYQVDASQEGLYMQGMDYREIISVSIECVGFRISESHYFTQHRNY